MSEIKHYRNRLRRLRLLQFLSQAYPEPLSDQMLLKLAGEDPELKPDMQKVRRSCAYLQDRGFARITEHSGDIQLIVCTADGIDYLEGDDPSIEGLAHPSEFLKGDL